MIGLAFSCSACDRDRERRAHADRIQRLGFDVVAAHGRQQAVVPLGQRRVARRIRASCPRTTTARAACPCVHRERRPRRRIACRGRRGSTWAPSSSARWNGSGPIMPTMRSARSIVASVSGARRCRSAFTRPAVQLALHPTLVLLGMDERELEVQRVLARDLAHDADARAADAARRPRRRRCRSSSGCAVRDAARSMSAQVALHRHARM